MSSKITIIGAGSVGATIAVKRRQKSNRSSPFFLPVIVKKKTK